MEKSEIAKSWALERVGCPYIYGGTGQVCTPAYRQTRWSCSTDAHSMERLISALPTTPP